MTRWLGLALAAGTLHAAVIRGSVVNHDGGEALSHAEVTLRAIAGSGGATMTGRTDSFGMFAFSAVPAGAYLVSASRQYWVTAFYGQKRWNSAGTPVVIEANDSLALSIRMHRFGAITGRLVDDNDVGIPDHEALAYRDAKPLQIAARAPADDYGRYRLYGLTPGTYLVRSAAKKAGGIGYLPQYAPSSLETDQARRVDVQLDMETTGIDVRPPQGRLFEVSGTVSGGVPAELTLAGDSGRQTVTTTGAFSFHPVAPGHYEIYGTARSSAKLCPSMLVGAHVNLLVARDIGDLAVALRCVQPTQIFYWLQSGGNLRDTDGLALQVRRVDLAGAGDAVNLGNGPASAMLAPGQWELMLKPPDSYAVIGFDHANSVANPRGRGDGWNAFTAGGYGAARFMLTGSPSSLRGVVAGAGREPAMGAPVYLEAYDRGTKARIGDLRTVYTSVRGGYEFSGLAPGAYRVLATFEYVAPDTATMELAGARTVTIGAGESQTADLDLFLLP